MREFISKYRYPLIFGCLGLFLGILIFTLGIIKTVILIILTICGFSLGIYLE
ncbi:DUF2273 domain-containing protein, partial [Enterococcus faecalis]|uniref:DUF2273 domain-containing protein n=2 Tax=Enterococcus TaxID=1350 RepID=UPI0011E75FAD